MFKKKLLTYIFLSLVGALFISAEQPMRRLDYDYISKCEVYRIDVSDLATHENAPEAVVELHYFPNMQPKKEIRIYYVCEYYNYTVDEAITTTRWVIDKFCEERHLMRPVLRRQTTNKFFKDENDKKWAQYYAEIFIME